MVAYRDGKAGRHPVQVVRVVAKGHDLGNDCLVGPFDAEDFCQLLQVVCGSLADGEDGIAEPTHAEVAKFLVKELHTKLAGQQRNVLDDSQANPPLLVFSQLNNGREKRLRQQLDPDD